MTKQDLPRALIALIMGGAIALAIFWLVGLMNVEDGEVGSGYFAAVSTVIPILLLTLLNAVSEFGSWATRTSRWADKTRKDLKGIELELADLRADAIRTGAEPDMFERLERLRVRLTSESMEQVPNELEDQLSELRQSARHAGVMVPIVGLLATVLAGYGEAMALGALATESGSEPALVVSATVSVVLLGFIAVAHVGRIALRLDLP